MNILNSKILFFFISAFVCVSRVEAAKKSKKPPKPQAELIFTKADVTHTYKLEEGPEGSKRTEFIFIDEHNEKKQISILNKKAKEIKSQWGDIFYDTRKHNEEQEDKNCRFYAEIKLDQESVIVCQSDSHNTNRIFSMLHRYYKQFEKRDQKDEAPSDQEK